MSIYIDRIEHNYNWLINHKDSDKLPSAEHIREILEGIFNKRTGRLLANPPSFNTKPLASMVMRLNRWHASGGNLGGLMMVHMDARFTAMRRGVDPDTFRDSLDHLVLLLRGGESVALDAWSRALGR